MRSRDFDYHLPPAAIAQRPVARGRSRLMVLAAAATEHRRIADLPQLLRPGDLLVVNDTRVIPARLFARREPGGGRVEVLLVAPLGGSAGASPLVIRGDRGGIKGIGGCEWEALVKPGRRVRPGTRLVFDDRLAAEVVAASAEGRRRLRFSQPPEAHLDRLGHVPLPPYVKRPDEPDDRERYQTIFAHHPGAIAAPTAGLHFTPALVAELGARGIAHAAITLHVGIGTFKPVTAEEIDDHRMEAERYRIPEKTAAAIGRARAGGGRLVAVGTTVVRTLESAAQEDGEVRPGSGETELFIRPGHRFRAVDLLLTNFHLPRSTLLMLVSAFAGRERVLAAYEEAVAQGYRFYSYGDAMLVEPRED